MSNGPNAAQIPLPENAQTLVMTPRELALYQAGEAMGQTKALRTTANFLSELGEAIVASPAAGQLAALLEEGATKAAANALIRVVAVDSDDQELVERSPSPTWAEMANMLQQVKTHPLVLAKQAAEICENGARSLLAQATQGDHAFAAKLAEVSGLTREQVRERPSLLGGLARAFLSELAKR